MELRIHWSGCKRSKADVYKALRCVCSQPIAWQLSFSASEITRLWQWEVGTWTSKHLTMTSLWRCQPLHALASASSYMRVCGKWVCVYMCHKEQLILSLSLSPLALQGSLCMSCRRVSDLLIEFSLDWRSAACDTKHYHVYVCTSMFIITLCEYVCVCVHLYLFALTVSNFWPPPLAWPCLLLLFLQTKWDRLFVRTT